MLKDPGQVTAEDYENYTNIMRKTLAFLKEDGSVKSNRGDKYKIFVKPIYEGWQQKNQPPTSERFGEGLPVKPSFVFLPSDINMLVDKHRLLLLQMRPGNTNVFNELQAITDELVRLGVFDEVIVENIASFMKFSPL